jgi:hypothetical protein
MDVRIDLDAAARMIDERRKSWRQSLDRLGTYSGSRRSRPLIVMSARIAADQGTHHLVIVYSSSLRSKVYQSRLEKKCVTDPRQ